MDQAEVVVRALFDRVWNAGDLSAVDELLASQYRIRSDPGDPWDGQVLTPEEFKQRFVISRAPFPDLKFDIADVVSDGARVAVGWTMRGTNQGPLGDRAPTGRPISVRGITIYYVEHGKITGHSQAVDRLSVLNQLGVLG